MTLNELKEYEIYLDENIHVLNEISDNDGDMDMKEGVCACTLFEVIGTILYEITFYGNPFKRDKSKQMLIDSVDSKNIISVLEMQLEEALKIEDYKDCKRIQNMIDEIKGIN
jgi:hypothetical protein